MTDSADPNSAVVGVDVVRGPGADPAAAGASTAAPAAGFDPAEHTVADVVAYLADHPDDADRVVELERAGKARTGIVGGG